MRVFCIIYKYLLKDQRKHAHTHTYRKCFHPAGNGIMINIGIIPKNVCPTGRSALPGMYKVSHLTLLRMYKKAFLGISIYLL